MRTHALALALSAVGTLAAADPPRPGPAEAKKGLWAGISVSHPAYVPGRAWASPFVIHFAVVNDGDKTVDPQLEASKLLVNGKELEDWAFNIAQGPRDNRFKALPPGDDLSLAMALGKYFTKPGTYRVSWKGKGFEAPEIVFRVLPR
jgi:hypothetical protein